MSMVEEKISIGSGDVEYRVKVKKFKEKMKKWPPGRHITNLSSFYYENIDFLLSIVPNGSTINEKGFVSIYLFSNSNHKVYINCELKMGIGTIRKLENQLIGEIGIGWPKFYDHSLNSLEMEQDLEIVCIIT